jgi:hypothetical protein
MRNPAYRLPIPQTSPTSIRSRQACISPGSCSIHTPELPGVFLAILLATLARVLVRAIPTHTGIPVQRETVDLILAPMSSSPETVPDLNRRKDSSME